MTMRPLLAVEGIETYYGASQALFGVSFAIRPGEVLALLGRNGMGKTTAVRSIVGLAPIARGRVVFDGEPVDAWPSYRIARAGIGLVPEGRQVFPALTVRENLVATARPAGDGRANWTLARVLDLFPALRPREGQLGSTLSGGEQQMLAIGRALLTNPRLLILDEATEGLAPLVRDEIWHCLAGLKAEGQALLVIDKNLAELAPLADRACVLEKGRVAWEGTPAELLADATAKHRYLGV
jgi:branched-chain amino acid transport system ATP-binding protein